MSLLDRWLVLPHPVRRRAAPGSDGRAVDHYRALLRTARPHEIERVHAEAFAALTPAQRRRLYAELSRSATPADRPWSDEPGELAVSATRAEARQPGFLECVLGPRGGGAFAGSLLGAVAGLAVDAVRGADVEGAALEVAGGRGGDLEF